MRSPAIAVMVHLIHGSCEILHPWTGSCTLSCSASCACCFLSSLRSSCSCVSKSDLSLAALAWILASSASGPSLNSRACHGAQYPLKIKKVGSKDKIAFSAHSGIYSQSLSSSAFSDGMYCRQMILLSLLCAIRQSAKDEANQVLLQSILEHKV